ncbi:MAG: hypothetical protein ACR2H3_16825 [Acidimicrobiales bacterium]
MAGVRGVTDDEIRHATDHPLVVSASIPTATRPSNLVIGPDPAGNLLEVIVLALADERLRNLDPSISEKRILR